MTNENEIWKDIPGYEGMYQVSNFGNVRSLVYQGKQRIKILKPAIEGGGYRYIILCKNGKPKNFKIHKLVMISFVGERPNGFDINHKDSNKLNNLLSNLEYISTRDNCVHGKNSMKKQNKSSKYVGVSWNKRAKKYIARIRVNNKLKYLGSFNNELDASQAYQKELSKIENNTIYASKQ